MKLSKNRLHKIKLKRNASRKKYNLRRKKGKYENSRKKYRRDNHIKQKTMKIYVGGDSGNITNTNTNKSYINISKSLDNYDCDPDKIDITVPDDVEEAKNKYNLIDNYLTLCPNDKGVAILTKWFDYIENFKKKFGKNPTSFSIDETCKPLFIGNMNYENVPDNKNEAEGKLSKYLNLLTKDQEGNNSKCHYSINSAIDIYMEKLNKKFPDTSKTNEQIPEPDGQTPSISKKCPSDKIVIGELFKPENQEDTCNKKKKILLQLAPDKNNDCKEEAEEKFKNFNNTFDEKCNKQNDSGENNCE